MNKVLFSWIGDHDLRSAEDNGAKGLGPICQAAESRQFDELVLLSDYPSDKTAPYLAWLKRRKNQDVQLIEIDLGGNPTDYRAIYEGAKRSVQGHMKQAKANVELTFHLSPGTPAMATIWVILANSVVSANLIHSSPERGVQNVDFPFDIAADYLPDLLKQKEKKISAMFVDHGPESAEFKALIHQSPIMKELVNRARIIAPYTVPVLIQGESGTGKELLANAIHNLSLRKNSPFVPINCGAIPASLFESELFGHKKGSFTGANQDKAGYIEAAEGGTLFLDEIGEMPLDIQVKLLRALNDENIKFNRVGESITRTANVRIISATNRNLIDEISEGKFREDLYHRLAIGILHLPPLRERDVDIDILIDSLMDDTNNKLSSQIAYTPKRLSTTARSMLLRHSWPGNVRELKNALLRIAIWSPGSVIDKKAIEEALLPFAKDSRTSDAILGRPLDDGFDLKEVIGEVARHYLERALIESGGNKSKAAKSLSFNSYQALDLWIKKHQIG